MNDQAAENAERLRRFLRDHGCNDSEAEQLVRAETDENRPAVTKWLFLEQLWPGIIDGPAGNPSWITRFVEQSRADPSGFFADAGLAMERILGAGLSAEDIGRVMRFAAYEAVFGVLDFLDDGYSRHIDDEVAAERGWALMETDGAGETTGRQLAGLHEGLLSLDPSGREGRAE